MAKKANGIGIASVVVIALLSVGLWVFNGWRGDMSVAHVERATNRENAAGLNTRVTVLEDRWDRIEADLADIKTAVGAKSSRKE